MYFWHYKLEYLLFLMSEYRKKMDLKKKNYRVAYNTREKKFDTIDQISDKAWTKIPSEVQPEVRSNSLEILLCDLSGILITSGTSNSFTFHPLFFYVARNLLQKSVLFLSYVFLISIRFDKHR